MDAKISSQEHLHDTSASITSFRISVGQSVKSVSRVMSMRERKSHVTTSVIESEKLNKRVIDDALQAGWHNG